MENAWSSVVYRPTNEQEGDSGFFQFKIPKDHELPALQRDLQECTRAIISHPYHPELWLNRARTLLCLGYPELVLGDCCKATLLLDPETSRGYISGEVRRQIYQAQASSRHLASNDSTNEALNNIDPRLVERYVLITSTKACSLMHYHTASIDFCRKGQAKFPAEEFFHRYLTMLSRDCTGLLADFPYSHTDGVTIFGKGCYKSFAYPWMRPTMFQRGPNAIAALRAGILSVSDPKCMLRRSELRDNMSQDANAASTQADCYGIFATKGLTDGEIVFEESTAAGALDREHGRCDCCRGFLGRRSTTLPCCKVKFCSTTCANLALGKYHRSICGRDIGSLVRQFESESTTQILEAGDRLLLRVLAIALQDSAPRPLDTTMISAMTCNYGDRTVNIYDYNTDTLWPIRILQWLGVDVFQDLSYDTWILHTIKARLSTNPDVGIIDNVKFQSFLPLRSLINHSCRPNITVNYGGNISSTGIAVLAERDITAGEELFDSYHFKAQPLPHGLKERRALLRDLLGGDCQCSRCLEHEDTEYLARSMKMLLRNGLRWDTMKSLLFEMGKSSVLQDPEFHRLVW